MFMASSRMGLQNPIFVNHPSWPINAPDHEMDQIWPPSLVGHCDGKPRQIKRRWPWSPASSGALWLGEGQQVIKPVSHRLAKVIAGAAEFGVAVLKKLLLLALQGAPGARIALTRLADHFGVHRIDLAIEIGELRIGADGLFDRPPGGGAVEARPVVDGHQRPDAFDLQRQRLVVRPGGRMIGIEPDFAEFTQTLVPYEQGART